MKKKLGLNNTNKIFNHTNLPIIAIIYNYLVRFALI
jgi:hypothetical protein